MIEKMSWELQDMKKHASVGIFKDATRVILLLKIQTVIFNVKKNP